MANEEGCPSCGDHTFPRSMHLRAGDAEAMRSMLESVEVRPYNPKAPPAATYMELLFDEGLDAHVGEAFAPTEYILPEHGRVQSLREIQETGPRPQAAYFMVDNPSVEGNSVGGKVTGQGIDPETFMYQDATSAALWLLLADDDPNEDYEERLRKWRLAQRLGLEGILFPGGKPKRRKRPLPPSPTPTLPKPKVVVDTSVRDCIDKCRNDFAKANEQFGKDLAACDRFLPDKARFTACAALALQTWISAHAKYLACRDECYKIPWKRK